MKYLKLLIAALLISQPVLAAQTHPGGSNLALQYNNNDSFGGMVKDTQAAYAAHNTVMNGLAYDPRDPAYGAICGGYNTFSGNGSTVTFSYTIPFTGSTSTDNSGFMVFYEPTNGSGSATILTTSDFSVTGVNSGSGGTITLNSAPPAANTLFVVHDDSAGLVAASTAAVASGGYVSVPDGCTIYGSQSLGTQLAEGAQLIGQSFAQNYTFQGTGTKPIMRVIAPTGAAPNFGINISGKNQQFFEGFEITSNISAPLAGLGFLRVPVLIGANGASGAGGGQSPGIVAQYMTFNEGVVGFGSPIGGNSAFIFAVVRFSNFVGNTAGIYGPLSDQQIIGNNFSSNGGFGSYGSQGGMVIGPQQGAVGASGAARIEYNRFEFNYEGVVVKAGALINMDGNQFDGNSLCGLDLNTFWSGINVTGGWFHGNANGGSPYHGSTTAGRDADICFNGGAASGSGGFYGSNINFLTNYGSGSTAPLGSNNATTPPYVLDFGTAGADNNNVTFTGGSAMNVAGNNGASVTDFMVFRNGVPSNLKIDINGQPIYGKNANGNNPSLVRGIPTAQYSTVAAYGDHNTLAPNNPPPGSDYGTLISTDMGAGYTNNGVDRTLTCDSLDAGLIYEQLPGNTSNPLLLFLPSNGDPSYGGGGDTTHLQDVSNCYKAALSWVTVPSQYKVLAQNASCVQSGTWANDSGFGGNIGVTSATNGSTLTCTLTSYGAPLYAWYRVHDSDGGTFTYSVDGGTAVSVNTAPLESPTGDGLGDTFAESLIRIPYISAGSHTITFAVTSSTSASNNVYILGVGTAPNVAYQGGGPTIFAAGMPYQQNNTNAAISLSYDSVFKSDIMTLQQDGLNANYVDVKKYMNATNDITSATILTVGGESNVHDAFEAQLQYVKSPSSGSGIVDPRNFGAACNTTNFMGGSYASTDNSVTITNGSPVISINGYTFRDGVATQTGGGDIGKVISVFGPGSTAATLGVSQDAGPTTYIVSVDTVHNTATLGANMQYSNTHAWAVMGGYPSNPADPSTAQDDTIAIQNASAAATSSGSKVFLPNKCFVHNLKLKNGTLLEGSMGGTDYSSATTNLLPTTVLYCASNGFAEDPHTCINIAVSASDTSINQNVRLKDFQMQCTTYPYLGYVGITLAGIGSESQAALYPEGVILDHVSHFLCPVEYGIPFSLNQPVTFTASVSGSTMNVSAITSQNLETIYKGLGLSTVDWLANGRTITEASVTASFSGGTMTVSAVASGALAVGQRITGTSIPTNTTITALGSGSGGTGTYTVSDTATHGSRTITAGTTIVASALSGGTGNYTIANPHTLASQTMTSPVPEMFVSGSVRYNQFSNGGIDMNGDMSDLADIGSVFTGGFNKCLWMGPDTGGVGNGANRFALERFEECNNGAMMLDTLELSQFTGIHFQFNTGYAVETRGTWGDIAFVGGTMQGNGSSTGAAPNRSQIALGGTGTNFSVVGTEFAKTNFAFGGTANYIFSTVSGSNVDYVSVEGGDVKDGFNTAMFNWAGNTPTHYKQVAPGIPYMDTTNSQLAVGTSGGVSVGNPAPSGSTGSFEAGKSGTTQGRIVIDGSTSSSVTQITNAAAGGWTFTWPTSSGTNGYALTTNGTGIGSWAIQPPTQLSFQPGLLGAATTGKTSFYKIPNASTLANLIGSAQTFTCAANPTLAMYECGTSTTCSGGTQIGQVLLSAANTATPGLISNFPITAGDYVAFAITGGTCTAFDPSVTAQLSTGSTANCAYAYPLDTYTANGAYSFRLLRTAYSGGNIVTLQRSSDSTTKTFTATTSQCGIDIFDTFFDGSTYTIVTWFDQSGNGSDLTSHGNPVVTLNCQNNDPCITLDGSTTYFTGTVPSTTDDTFAAVGELTSIPTGAGRQLIDIGTANTNDTQLAYSVFANACSSSRFVSGSPSRGTKACSANTWYRFIGTNTNALSSIYLNGVIGTNDTTALTMAGQTAITLGAGSTHSSSFFPGKVSEAIIFSPSLAISDSNIVSLNQGAYWGVP